MNVEPVALRGDREAHDGAGCDQKHAGNDSHDANPLYCRRPYRVAAVGVYPQIITGKHFSVSDYNDRLVSDWTFLTNHARALLLIAHDPDARLRDLAGALDVTERTAYGIVADLNEAGYVVKEKDGRRNRYHIQEHLPLRDEISRERTIGEVLDLLLDAKQRKPRPSRRA